MGARRPVGVAAALWGLGLLVAACSPPEAPAPAPEPETPPAEEVVEDEPDTPAADELVIGYLLPETGPLATLGPAQIQAVEMAVEGINAAGGVFGTDVVLIGGDEAGDETVASATVDELLAEGAHAIVGAAASGMSLAVLEQIVGAGVLQCSPSNTSPTFTDVADRGLYFRTIPSDALQGPVLAERIVADGHDRVVLLARDDVYGESLAAAIAEGLETADPTVVDRITIDPGQSGFADEARQVGEAEPDAVVLLTYEESPALLSALLEEDLGSDQVGLYGVDGLRDPGLPDLVGTEPAALDGMQGTAPDPGATPDFLERFEAHTGGLEPVFAAPAYDCATLVALAAEATGSTEGPTLATALPDLFEGTQACATFADCRTHLEAGEPSAYEAAGGMEAFTDAGEPVNGPIEIWAFVDGDIVTLESVEARLPAD